MSKLPEQSELLWASEVAAVLTEGTAARRHRYQTDARHARRRRALLTLREQTMLRSAARPLARVATRRVLRPYHQEVIDHFEKPLNVGSLDKDAKDVGTGLVGAPACGDVMKLQIKVDDDGNIVDAKFKTFGCGSAIASSSVASEWVKGRNIGDESIITNKEIAAHLNLPPVKLHCSMLAEDAINAAIADYKAKQEVKKEAEAS